MIDALQSERVGMRKKWGDKRTYCKIQTPTADLARVRTQQGHLPTTISQDGRNINRSVSLTVPLPVLWLTVLPSRPLVDRVDRSYRKAKSEGAPQFVPDTS